MSSAATAIDHAEQQCLRNGTKLTKKRKAVLSGLLKTKRAMTAYELSDFCKEEFDEAMPATTW